MRTISKEYRELKEDDVRGTHLKVEVYYSKGGMNYFSSTVERRGVYVSVSPISKSVSSCGNYSTESYTAFTGKKLFLEERKRWSASLENYEVHENEIQKIIDML